MARDRKACLEATRPPPEARAGDTIPSAHGWRNVEKIKKRYHDDVDGRWGEKFELRVDQWRGWDPGPEHDDEADGVSVSLAGCTCGRCSPLLHPTPERFDGAVRIDVDALSSVIGFRVHVVYTPERPDDPTHAHHNPCHAVLIPERDRLDDVIKQLKRLGTALWPAKLPRTEEHVRDAEKARKTYDAVFVEVASVEAESTPAKQ